MSPEARDLGYLWDILDAARRIREFMSGVDYPRFIAEPMRTMAVERAFEIIGEAGRGLSDGFREAHPQLQWRSIIGLRNVIAHDYGEIDYESLYEVAISRVPELIRILEDLVPADPDPKS